MYTSAFRRVFASALPANLTRPHHCAIPYELSIHLPLLTSMPRHSDRVLLIRQLESDLHTLIEARMMRDSLDDRDARENDSDSASSTSFTTSTSLSRDPDFEFQAIHTIFTQLEDIRTHRYLNRFEGIGQTLQERTFVFDELLNSTDKKFRRLVSLTWLQVTSLAVHRLIGLS